MERRAPPLPSRAVNVEVVNTGTELLLGNVVNSHLAFLAQALFPLGLRIQRQVTVPDGDAIRDALKESFARADVVLVTGGLGPTTDDITRDVTAELLGAPLLEDREVLAAIHERFARRGFALTERVKLQALVPRGAAVLPNAHGTAPGLYFEKTENSPHLFLLPGPPRELKPMFNHSALPILRRILPPGSVAECRSFTIPGVGESAVEAEIGEALLAIPGIELGYCARPGSVDVRCIGSKEMLDRAEEIIMGRFREHVVARDGRPLEAVIVGLLAARGAKLAVAESCTGGCLSNQITNVPGSSAVFIEGVVTYSNDAKTRLLEVDAVLLGEHGAVSAAVASAMAENALRLSGADYALSLTGIAGPGGGTEGKPVGTVFIGLAGRGGVVKTHQHHFPTDRETFKYLASQTALYHLHKTLISPP